MSQPIENKSKWATRLIEESGIKRYIDSPLHSDFNKPKPDFTCSINEYGIVIAYKKDVKRQLKLNRGKVSMTETNTLGYAVNKACKCAENILRSKNCPVRRIFAIGISGDEDNHLIDSVLVRKGMLAENGEEPPIAIGRPRKVEDLQDFSPQYISDSLIYSVTTEEKYAPEHYARTFRNEIRSYTNFTENEILLTGTGMLLAALGARNVKGGHRPLPNSEEGKKILFGWLKAALKLPKGENFIYYFFEILKAPVLHEGTPRLPKHSTPAQHLMEFLEKDVIPLKEVNKDSIKTFYTAFKRLMERRSPLASTPEFVTSLFYDILEITSSDRVLDALCGGGDLMTAIAERMEQSGEDICRDHQVMGMENPAGLQMAGIAEATFKLNRTEDFCKVLEGSLNDFKGKANIGILCPSYVLGTRGKKPVICAGVNPSTAEPDHLDPTLQSVSRIAAGNGFDSFLMFNVYAQRATRPDDMDRVRNDRLHEENRRAFRALLSMAAEGGARPVVWAAWGAVIEKRPWLTDCVRDFRQDAAAFDAAWVCAGRLSKAGHPHHPLYLRKDEAFRPFDIGGYLR